MDVGYCKDGAGVVKEEGGRVDAIGALHDQAFRSCGSIYRSEVLEYLGVSRQIRICNDLNRRRLRPFEVRECVAKAILIWTQYSSREMEWI